MLRYSSNYYYNLHVFLKLKAGIFCVEPEYLRSEMVQIIEHGKNISLGNITDNVVMASCGRLKQFSFTTELNIICESCVDL